MSVGEEKGGAGVNTRRGNAELLVQLGEFAPVLIAVACFAAYFNSFNGPFIFDDVGSLTSNPTILRLWPPYDLLNPPKNLTVGGRPIVNLTLAVNYAAGGFNTFGYHLLNLVIHILASLTLYGLVRRTLRVPALGGEFAHDGESVAFSVALLWALHPLQTESVSYIIQRCESLGGLFYLATLYAFSRGAGEGEGEGEGGRKRWLGASVAFCALGMGSKEVVVSAPLLTLLYDRAFVAGSFREALRVRGRYYAALALTWSILGYLVFTGDNRVDTAGFGVGYSWWEYGLTQIYAVTMYLRLVFWPWPLLLDYGDKLHPLTWDILPRALLLAALLGATVHSLIRRPGWGFVGAFFFAILAPTSSVISIKTQTMAEHRMYLPLAAVVMVAVLGARFVWLEYLKGRLDVTKARKLPLVALAFLAVVLGVLTMVRNSDYRTEYTMMYDILKKNPTNHRVHETLSLYYLEDREYEKAFAHFDEAMRLKPEPERSVRLAIMLLQFKRPVDAEALMRHALKNGGGPRLYNMLGVTLATQGRSVEAAPHFKKAVELAPDSANYRMNLQKALSNDWTPGSYHNKPQ